MINETPELLKEMVALMREQQKLSAQIAEKTEAAITLVSALAEATMEANPQARAAMEAGLRQRLSEANAGENELKKGSALLALQLMGWEPL